MTELIKLIEIPLRENLEPNALLILPCKVGDAYQPWRLLSDGERRTTLAQAMRSQIVKTPTGFEYDLHCLGIAVVDDSGKKLNKALINNSFNHIYYYLGTGQYSKVVIPPMDPTLPKAVQDYLREKYQELERFIAENQTNEFFEKGKTAGANNPIAKQFETPEIAMKYYASQKGNIAGFVKNFADDVATLGMGIVAPVIFVPKMMQPSGEKTVEKAPEPKPGLKK